jgi:hypothetical protein
MVVNYSNAKIYKIVDNTNGNMYIGSTTQYTLAKRLTGHVRSFKAYQKGYKNNLMTSFKILENGDYDIVLLEIVDDCTCKDQLKAKERYHIENNRCVNKIIVGRTRKEHYEANKSQILQKHKKYYESNKEQINQNKKLYYQNNLEVIRAKQNAKTICHCGGHYLHSHKAKHERTKKHQLSLQQCIETNVTIPIKTKMSTNKTNSPCCME